MAPTIPQQIAYAVQVRSKIFQRVQLIYDISNDPTKEQEFLIRCERLESSYKEFDEINNKIISLNVVAPKEEQITDVDSVMSSFEDIFFRIQVKYRSKKAQSDLSICEPVNPQTPSDPQPRFAKLPQIDIRKFSGERLEEFDSFISLYNKLIHTRDSLADIEKYSYLVSFLEGPALKIVQAVQFSAHNYQIAYTRLTERYQNPRVLANYYANRILETKGVGSESLQGLRLFLDQIYVNVQSLKALELADLSDFIFLHLGLRFLDPRTRQLFENDHVKIKSIPSFNDLVTFVKNRCSVLEMSEASSSSYGSSSSKPSSQINSRFVPGPTKRSFVTHGSSDGSSANNSAHSNSQTHHIVCPLCSGPHKLSLCTDFLNRPPDARRSFVKSVRRCFACFGTHSLAACQSTYSCKVCRSKSHHSLLHFDSSSIPTAGTHSSSFVNPKKGAPPTRTHYNANSSQNPGTSTSRDVTPPSEPSQSLSCKVNPQETPLRETQVLLGTAQVRIQDVFGNFHSARVCIDLGSQLNLITVSMAQKLNLPKRYSSTRVSGVGNSTPMSSRGLVSCNIRPVKNISPQVSFDAIILPSIASDMPTLPVSRTSLEVYGDKLADPQFHVPGPVDILLGAQVCSDIIDTQSHVIKGTPSVLPTVFGYVLFGNIPSDFSSNLNIISLLNTQSLFVSSCNEDPLSSQLREFFEMEKIPESSSTKLSPQDESCEKFFNETTRRGSDGKYICRLPFKSSVPPNLGSTRLIATSRLLKLETRLSKNETFKTLYHENLKDYLDSGHMDVAPIHSPYVLTHHGVLKESSTSTKCRVVFNASERSDTHQSLNEALMVGPKLQSNIADIILNFRTYPIALTCDIRQMYRCIDLDPRDCKYQHILWRFNPSDPITEFELKTISFGLACAPYIAQKVLQKLAIDEGARFPRAALAVQNSVYIDDFVTGSYSIDEAISFQQELTDLLASGGFSLRKWASSEPSVLKNLQVDHLEKPHKLGNSESIKVLGLQWDPVSDSFFYVVSPELKDSITKRDVLSQIARIYDIQGFLSPITVWLKVFMQKLWLLGSSWDGELPPDLDREWKLFVQELPLLNEVRIPRYLHTYQCVSVDLVGFCDASAAAMAAVVYLRVSLLGGEVHSYLIRARTKVAPIKTLTIPKLELSAALLLANLLKSLDPLIQNLKISQTYLFSDSTIVLGWLKTPPYLLNTFVSNRVQQILEVTSPSSWFHIKSGENSADVASRGCYPSKILSNDLWWHGPPFLKFPVSEWPCSSSEEVTQELSNLPEMKAPPCMSLKTQLASSEYLTQYLSKFSSLLKLQRVFAWILRFTHNARHPAKRNSSPSLLASEMTNALSLCIKLTQHLHYQSELVSLSKGQEVSGGLLALSPFVSPSGLLSVGGRLKYSPLCLTSKHPVLIPRESHLASLIVDHFHIYSLHGGPQLVQSLIRKQYWIPNVKALIRKRIFRCMRCFRLHAKPTPPFMGDIPKSRFEQGRPFLRVALDMGGPYLLKDGNRRNSPVIKAYIAIFVCMSTRCMHLELVTSLTTEACLAALDRFISRRGLPTHLVSDNGTNYRGSARHISDVQAFLKASDYHVHKFLADREISWSFHPPGAPNFSGLAEAGIKSTKFHLKRVLSDQALRYEEFYTLLVKIEASLNSRPLYALSSSPDDGFDYLSPGHFLIGAPLLARPDYDISDQKISPLQRWSLINQAFQSFWKRWSKEYLHTLIHRPKWTKKSVNVKIGDLVLITSENVPPLKWPLARVTAVHPGSDDIVRVVTLKTSGGTLTRSVNKLVVLPIAD
ncbi:hypothetical protein M8J77_023385 [Diaphorina citri]|nr:hypothetical protein M8J77_023385 [Diaphorina citri]